jgi:uncharacterized protein (TIGR02271 family)
LVYEERYADYEVYDQLGKRLGKVDTLFLDEDDQLEYIGVKIDLLGTESILIPAEVVTLEDRQKRMVVGRSSNVIERGPTLADEEQATPELQQRVRLHYGLARPTPSSTAAEERAAPGATTTYGAYYDAPLEANAGGLGRSGTQGPSTRSGPSGPSGAPGEDEIRVQRSEEELVAGTREREAGAMRVRKRVRVDRERIEVPTRHEEVSVERVPVSSGEATEAQIGEDEVVVPVTEEEVVVSKRPVAKEEVRIKKDVVEDTEVVEEDVRREEIDVEDDTTRRGL